MSQNPTPPPGCTDECLVKWYLDNSGSAAKLADVADDGKHLWQSVRTRQCEVPQSLKDKLPDLIRQTQDIREAINKMRHDYRTALGYAGQGLT